jgi:L-fuculose-phosphate aldolase
MRESYLLLLCDYGRRLIADRLTTGTGGNLSIYDRDRNLIAITPSGRPYEQLTPDEISIINPAGKHVDGQPPSSEWPLHTAVYRRRPEVNAIVHTHSRFATTFAVLRQPIPACHYLVAVSGADEVRVAPYATFGTDELARQAVAGLGRDNCILLANHGLLAVEKDLHQAYNIALYIEEVAELYYRARAIGTPELLTRKEMAAARERFRTYGINSPSRQQGREVP